MKHRLRFGVVAYLLCGVFLFAQSNPPSTEQEQHPSIPRIIVLPGSSEVSSGGGRQFSAFLPGSAKATFTWSVSGPGCTGGTCGSISASGLYTAPMNVLSPVTVTVTATLASDPLREGSATVTAQPKTGAEAAPPIQGKKGMVYGGLEVLSDTMGVDFGPYLARVVRDVKMNWYNVIPESAKAPIMKNGNVVIEFAILKDGSVTGMKLVYSSGDIALDRAAWTGITVSNPFPPLPTEFAGKGLGLRMKFLYNLLSRVEVSPTFVQLASGAQQQFAASVPGATWSLSCAVPFCGSISASGLYTAPLKVPNRMTVTVTATLAADPIKNDSALVTLQPSPPK